MLGVGEAWVLRLVGGQIGWWVVLPLVALKEVQLVVVQRDQISGWAGHTAKPRKDSEAGPAALVEPHHTHLLEGAVTLDPAAASTLWEVGRGLAGRSVSVHSGWKAAPQMVEGYRGMPFWAMCYALAAGRIQAVAERRQVAAAEAHTCSPPTRAAAAPAFPSEVRPAEIASGAERDPLVVEVAPQTPRHPDRNHPKGFQAGWGTGR
jgi:hypothetical protein